MPVIERKKISKTQKKNTKIGKNFDMLSWFYFPVLSLTLEIIFRLVSGTIAFDVNLLISVTLTLAVGFLLSFIVKAFHSFNSVFFKGTALRVVNKIIPKLLMIFIPFYFGFEYEYDYIMKSGYFYFSSGMTSVGKELFSDFYSVIFNALTYTWFYILLITVLPITLSLVFYKKIYPHREKRERLKFLPIFLCVAIAFQAVGMVEVQLSVYKDYYTESLSGIDGKVKHFGLLPFLSLDIKQLIFGKSEKKVKNPYKEQGTKNYSSDEYNVTDIDFDNLILNDTDDTLKEMDEYYSTTPATNKNEYTGMFKDYNLIYLTCESFSYKLIDKNLTPTLYKMYNQGFQFDNFYNTMWGGGTASGEYAGLSGQFYLSNPWAYYADTYQPFALGNQLKSQGYSTYAYHDHSYTYYGRDKSHPNMGYTYKGVGNGLNITDQWPESDNEMAEATINDYINADKFHAYYMTVSGHGNYNYTTDAMAIKNKERVKNLDCSDELKAYYAANLEVEDMMSTLVYELKKKGALDKTVFVITADHYPYLLSNDSLSNLYGIDKKKIEENTDLQKNAFLVWSPSMKESVKVTKPCSTIDIMPTLENLFGLEYDSRLLAGKDILSDNAGFVIINSISLGGCWSWITEKGYYNSSNGRFTPNEGVEMSKTQTKEYCKQNNKIVKALSKYSPLVLDTNYYNHIYN